MNAEMTRYLEAIGDRLICSPKSKALLMEEFQQELADFALENPEASYEAICHVFGNPDMVADRLAEGIDQKEIDAARRRPRNILLILLVIIAVIGGALAYLYYQSIQLKPDESGVVTIKIYEDTKET